MSAYDCVQENGYSRVIGMMILLVVVTYDTLDPELSVGASVAPGANDVAVFGGFNSDDSIDILLVGAGAAVEACPHGGEREMNGRLNLLVKLTVG